jgi:Uncharacterized protein, possibly involved in motility
MIGLTRLNGQRFVLNADLIRTVESTPDTVITLTTGEHIIVRDTLEDVVARVVEYGRLLRRSVCVDGPGWPELCDGLSPAVGGR